MRYFRGIVKYPAMPALSSLKRLDTFLSLTSKLILLLLPPLMIMPPR